MSGGFQVLHYNVIQETIRDAVEDSITWPVRKIIPILPGDYRYANFKWPITQKKACAGVFS